MNFKTLHKKSLRLVISQQKDIAKVLPKMPTAKKAKYISTHQTRPTSSSYPSPLQHPCLSSSINMDQMILSEPPIIII
jgi:hypothetical protein